MKTTILSLFAAVAILSSPVGAVEKKWECTEAKNCKGQHDVKQKPAKGYVYSNDLDKKTKNGGPLGGLNSSRPDRR